MSADWSLWADIPHTELWKAVALSMDIEPTKLPGYDLSCVRDPFFSYPFSRCPQKFKDRLEIAMKHLGRALAPVTYRDPEWNTEVDLQEISRWAASLNSPWDLPAQFPKAKESQLSDIQPSESVQATSSPPDVQPPDPAASSFTSKSKAKQKDMKWIPLAQQYARQYIEERAKKGSYPNQNDIGDHISKRFRDEGILSFTGKAPTGSYIKRYALTGIRAR
jgi:hypothetical protein